MWWILILKNWKLALVGGLLVVTNGAWAIEHYLNERQLNKVQRSAQSCFTERDTLAASLGDALDAVTQQNESIEKWKTEAENTRRSLQDALSKPPRVIYRDRIVEVPSIVTGPCEQVFEDIADYIRGTINVHD